MEEEIDLIDYIKVIIKRWKMILCIFLVAVLVGGGVSLALPKTFQAQAVVKIGTVGTVGTVIEDISETIEILKGKFPGVIFSSPGGTSLNIKAQGVTPRQALDGANNAVDFLLSRHQEVYNEAYNEAKLSLEEEMNDIQSRLEKVGPEITEMEPKIQKQELEIREIEEKIKREESTSSQARALIIQGYLLRLTAEKDRKENFVTQRRQLLENERELKEKLKAKQFSEELNFEPTQVEISPVLPQNPIKPNIKLNLLVAAVLGIFMGVLIAFGREWWEKEKEEEK